MSICQAKELLVFPDILKQYPDDVSAAFFELANASQIAYRVPKAAQTSFRVRKDRCNSQDHLNDSFETCLLVIRQDVSACLQHTGGIVWETCYLLLTYLITKMSEAKDSVDLHKEFYGSILEVGAGCGLLGQGLAAGAAATTRIVLTEHPDAIENLLYNLEGNHNVLMQYAPNLSVNACILDWQHVERDIATNICLLEEPFDTIVGTDVLFSPKLVKPLLHTLHRLSHSQTVVFLCLQVRCAVSHEMLLSKAGDYNFDVMDMSEEVYETEGCHWGREMECLVLRLTRRT